MTNQQFINEELNHTHMAFYKELLLKCMDRYIDSSVDAITRTEWAVRDAQAAMKVLGYTNTPYKK